MASTSNGPRRGKAAAFTLIELMAVVSIIAVLVAIMLPSLGRAREQAKAVKCASDLNSIVKGMFYYMNDPKDGNGYLPQLGGALELGYWATQIRPYVKIKRSRVGASDALLHCPADSDPIYRWIDSPGRQLAGEFATVADKLRADAGTLRGARRRSPTQSELSPLIEPVSYAGSCETLKREFRPAMPRPI